MSGVPSNVNNAVISGTPVLGNFPARIRRTTSKVAIENEVFGILVFEAICNNSYLVNQDVIVGARTGSTACYTFVQARPTRETLWVRTESTCSITRPSPKGGAAAQMPVSGALAAPGYGGIPKSTEMVMTLTNGLYNFSATGSTPASIQCGLQPLRKIKDGNSLGTPTDLYREEFLIYVPDLPGEMLSEMDRINFSNQDRYEVAVIFSTALTGLSGNICVVEKLSV